MHQCVTLTQSRDTTVLYINAFTLPSGIKNRISDCNKVERILCDVLSLN